MLGLTSRTFRCQACSHNRSSRDIANIALLASNSTKTLSLLQLDYMIDGRSEAASVVSVVVILVTVGVAFLARLCGIRLAKRN